MTAPEPRGIDQVQIRGVAKRYGHERALAGVTLELTRGSMCALLGHNGAGKTTLLGIVSTLVRPSGGSVAYRAGGAMVSGAAVRREIGMLAHASLCYGELTARENLALIAGLYEIDGSAAVIDGVLDRVGLDRKARDRAARCSASPWRARCSPGPRCCCSTSRSPAWTATARCRSASSSVSCATPGR